MATVIDDIELDETNTEFKYASEFIRDTDRIVYLTGKAGTGKTTFLRYIRKITTKKTVVLAPTGIAAVNASGQTIHSFFKIYKNLYIPGDKHLREKAGEDETDKSTIYDHFRYFKEEIDIIKGMELLIIDEISMVRCDLLDVVDRLLKVFRKRKDKPFGGVQVILIGDTFQLPPVATAEEWNILSHYYTSKYFFSSKVIEQNKPVYIELKKIYRQHEQEFIDLLNRVRVNQVSPNDLKLLNEKYNPTFTPKPSENYIHLATRNYKVKNYNLTKLAELPTEVKLFPAIVTDKFPENIRPTDTILQLKEGAQIMFIRNNKSKGYYNGTIAIIGKIEGNKIVVEISEKGEFKTIIVEKYTWNNIKYSKIGNEIKEETIGSFTQFPIKLAWALTVHKSQGKTFEKVITDLSNTFALAPGQVYVALSRCTTFSGLVLKTQIKPTDIQTAPEVLEFAKNETPETLIVQELSAGKANLYYKKTREEIRSLNFSGAYLNFVKAIKFRNDIETETLKKYFITTLNRLSSYKQKYINGLIENKILKEENEKLQLSILGLENEKTSLQTRLYNQKEAIKFLLDEKKELENEIEEEKSQILLLNADKINAERSILFCQNLVQEQKANVSDLEITIRGMKREIDRLGNLKWHEKLLGKK